MMCDNKPSSDGRAQPPDVLDLQFGAVTTAGAGGVSGGGAEPFCTRDNIEQCIAYLDQVCSSVCC